MIGFMSRLSVIVTSLVLSIGAINMAYGSSSGEDSSVDGLLLVKGQSATGTSDNPYHRLFPEQFTSDQVQCFFDKAAAEIKRELYFPESDIPEEITLGNVTPDSVFYEKIMPYWFQFLSGNSHSYAGRIVFLEPVLGEDVCLYGKYFYSGADFYQNNNVATNEEFLVKFQPAPGTRIYNTEHVKAGPCRLINLKQSILGDKDFYSTEVNRNPMYTTAPEMSWYHLDYWTSERFVREEAASGYARLPASCKRYLLALHQLKGVDVYTADPLVRDQLGEHLFEALLDETACKEQPTQLDKYLVAMAKIRARLLAELGVPEAMLPKVPDIDAMDVMNSKVFMVLPAE